MGKIKTKTTRVHIKASVTDAGLSDTGGFPKLPAQAFQTKPLEEFKLKTQLLNIKNPFGDVEIDPKLLQQQAVQYKVKVEEKKAEAAVLVAADKPKEAVFLNKRQRRQKKRDSFHVKLKDQNVAVKLENNKKNAYKLSQYKTLRDALHDVESKPSAVEQVKHKNKSLHMIDPKRLKNVPKSLRKKKEQDKLKERMAFKNRLKAKRAAKEAKLVI